MAVQIGGENVAAAPDLPDGQCGTVRAESHGLVQFWLSPQHFFDARGQQVLVLTRHVGESVVIGDDVKVVVVSIDQNKVQLGVIAPKDTTVHRKEIYDRINAGEK